MRGYGEIPWQQRLMEAAAQWRAEEPAGTTSEILDGGAYDDEVAEIVVAAWPAASAEAWQIVRRVYDDEVRP